MPRVREKDVNEIARAFHEASDRHIDRFFPDEGFLPTPWTDVALTHKQFVRTIVRQLMLDGVIVVGEKVVHSPTVIVR